MVKTPVVPDAWEDDWESAADKADAEPPIVEEEVKITKAERLAKHAETNRKIWQNAEEPEMPFFLAARDDPPLKSDFKPALKVLSRKPAPKVIQKIDPVTGLAQMSIEDDEEEEEKKDQPSPEELRYRAQKEREEKQKRYDEVRARIMGTGSGASSPGTTTPPAEDSRGGSRGRGRGRGKQSFDNQRPLSRSGSNQLFDPSYTPKPGAVSIQKRNGEISRSGTSTPKDEDQIIRTPKGPDGNGRGGFGFPQRGGKTS